MIRRFLAVLKARNLEFLRDRSALGWNIALPALIVIGMWFIFSGGDKPLFKVAVLNATAPLAQIDNAFLKTRYVDFYTVEDTTQAQSKVAHNQVDMSGPTNSSPSHFTPRLLFICAPERSLVNAIPGPVLLSLPCRYS